MNTDTITTAFDNLRSIANQFSTALQDMGRVLEAAVHDLKDRDEQIRVQQERISSLEEDNKRLQERLAQAENDLWAARREVREATAARDTVVSSNDSLTRQLAEAKEEGVKLREIILTVATSVDSVINPKPVTMPEPNIVTTGSPDAVVKSWRDEPKAVDDGYGRAGVGTTYERDPF